MATYTRKYLFPLQKGLNSAMTPVPNTIAFFYLTLFLRHKKPALACFCRLFIFKIGIDLNIFKAGLL